ncbi:MAG: C25 family cysteine peptidase, partial [Candidatus Eisenbacteria bacterium]
KLSVTQRGIHRVTGLDLLNAGVADLSSINPSTLRVFNGGGLLVLPSKLPSSLDTWMEECAILVSDGGDGRFDQNDFVLFYGLGTSDWVDLYRAGAAPTYHENQYTGENVYWLTWNGSFTVNPQARRVPQKSGAPLTSGAYVPQSFRARLHVEENREYDPSTYERNQRWEKWWFRRLSNLGSSGTTSYLFDFTAPGAEPAVRCSVSVRVWSPACSPLSVTCPTKLHGARALMNRQFVDDNQWVGGNKRSDLVGNGFWAQERDSLIITVTEPQDEFYLAWYEFFYGRRFAVDSNSFAFASPDTSGVVKFSLTGVTDTTGLRLLDVTQYFSPIQIGQFALQSEGAGYRLEFEDTLQAGSRKYYLLVNNAGLKSPTRLRLRTFQRYLRDAANGADYLIITHESLATAVEPLRSLREARLEGISDPVVMVVTTSEIYDEFSWGLEDAGAIRDLVMYAYWYWTGTGRQVAYVTLAGDASYDFRNYYGYGLLNQVPTWENQYDSITQTQLVNDDFFGLLDGPGDRLLDVSVGRIPVRTPAEAAVVINEKTVSYVNSPLSGVWRNKAVIVADDEKICQQPDGLGFEHTLLSEWIAERDLPATLDKTKIYLTEYSLDPGSCYKTQAKNAFINSFNDGALIVNYIGHGSWNVLATEQVFQIRDVALLSGGAKLALFFAGSCRVAKFDEPFEEGLGEALLRQRGGGAIASVSATELVFSYQNYAFNSAYFQSIFVGGRLDSVLPLGAALQATKTLLGLSYADTV